MEWLPYFLLIAGWLVYFTLHSVLAFQGIKDFFPNINYRLIYNVFAIVSLAIPAYFHFNTPSYLLWKNQWISFFGIAIFMVGLIIMKQSFRGYSLNQFLGLSKQIESYELYLEGWNKRVRHPLYFGSIILVFGAWLFTPTVKMSISGLMMVAYFYVGSYFEEKRLVKQFGEVYKQYQKATPKLFPRLFSGVLISILLFGCSKPAEIQKTGFVVFDRALINEGILTFSITPKQLQKDTFFLDTFKQHQFVATKSGEGFIIPPNAAISISSNEITGNGSPQTLYYKGLANDIKINTDSLSKLLGKPKDYLKHYLQLNKKRKAGYHKSFLSEDTERLSVFKLFDLGFKLQNAQTFLTFWETDTNVFLVQERVDSLNRLLPKVHSSLLYHPLVINSIWRQSSGGNDTISNETINAAIKSLYEMKFPPTIQQIVHLQFLSQFKLLNPDLPIENTLFFDRLENPEFYFFLNELMPAKPPLGTVKITTAP